MVAEGIGWIPIGDAVKLVERTQECYEEIARKLLREAVNKLQVRSRKVPAPDEWIESTSPDGRPAFSSNRGECIELCREDILRLWPERQQEQSGKAAQAPKPVRAHSRPVQEAVLAAILELFPEGIPATLRAQEVHDAIIKLLNQKHIPASVPKAVQRLRKKRPDLWQDGQVGPSEKAFPADPCPTSRQKSS